MGHPRPGGRGPRHLRLAGRTRQLHDRHRLRRNNPEDQAQFERYWPADLHLVGKEIIRFHCVYWPAFLLAAGLPTPRAITAHGWLLFDNSKMSKSKGNIVRTETILDTFGDHYRSELVRLRQPEPTKADADLFASDVLRYFLLREIPFGQDGSFSFDALITRYNADLANGYGNLVSRTLSLIERHFSGFLPLGSANLIPEATELRSSANIVASESRNDFARNQFTRVTTSAAVLIGMADGFFSANIPWKLAKSSERDDREKLAAILYTAAESIRIITALLYPILPYATAKVWAQLGLGDIEEAARNGGLGDLQWGGLKPGTRLGPLSPIFPRAPKELAQAMADIESSNAVTHTTTQVDARTNEATEFREGSLASAAGAAPVAPEATDRSYPSPSPHRLSTEIVTSRDASLLDPTHPAAPPRTSGLQVENPIASVAGSIATTTERALPPSHTEAKPSGPFNTPASARPITADAPTAVPEATPQITIDDFAKVELRVARILVCERIPKADKLLRLEVDLGSERRQILSGIAEWYTPDDLIGRKIVVITNLAPRKMRGLESHGMLLAASAGENGKPALATFADSDNIDVGARLK